MSEMKFFLLMIVGVFSLIAGIMMLANYTDSIACKERWSSYGETKYSFVSGCRVMIDNKWIPSSAVYYNVNEKKIEVK